MNPDNLKIYENAEDLGRGAARLFAEGCLARVREKGGFTAALSGGSTPSLAYALLASEFAQKLPWDRVHLFWGDERCVPPEDPQSNYRLCRETLISKVDIPEGNIHRIKGEVSPKEAALLYEAEIRRYFGSGTDGIPSFDLVFLGLGNDGHTLSLFPGTKALLEDKRLVIENFVPRLGSYRVTMTLPLVNRSRMAVFLVSGKEKSLILKEVLGDGIYPADKIKPEEGLLWMVDREAAGLL